MTSDSTQNWLRAVAVCAVVVLTLTGSTLAPVATATAPVSTNERITNGLTSTATANTETVTVSGSVTYPNGSTAANVTLRWLTEDGGETDFQQVVTDANGSYTTTLEANRSYAAKLWQANLNDVNASTPTNVVYPRDGVADFSSLGWFNTSTTDVTRNYSFPVGHVLNVTIQNESGAPIENASVGLRDGEGETGASFYSYLHEDGVPTDAQGRMKHPPNPGTGIEVNGTTAISAQPPENTSYDSNSTQITVTSDRDVTGTLTDDATVSGTVLNPDGTPASNVTLEWEGVNDSGEFVETVTDADGEFSVQFDATGDYKLSYWQANTSAQNQTYPRDGVADFGNLGLVTVSGDETRNHTLLVGHALNVTVENGSGVPITNATADLIDKDPATEESTFWDGQVPADSQGRLKHPENPRPGIEVNDTIAVRVEGPESDYGFNYTEFDVQGPRNETMVLYETTTVSGTVRYPNGTVASNVTLRWLTDQNGGDFAESATGPNGTYTAEIREDHDYEVTMWQANIDDANPDAPTNVVYPKDDVADFSSLGWLNTTTGPQTQNYTLPVGHTLNVTVQNESGAPIENASVHLVDRQAGTSASFYSYLHADGVPTDAQGRMAHPPNPSVGLELNGTTDVSVWPPENTSYDDNHTEVTVTSDRNLTRTLSDTTTDTATVSGTVRNPDGTPASNVTLEWEGVNGTSNAERTVTDADGEFSVGFGESGDYRVTYWQGDVYNENVTFPRDGVADFGNLGLDSVADGTTTNYTLDVGHPLNVTVENDTGAPVDEAKVVLSDRHPDTDGRAYFYGYRDGDVPTDAQGRMKHPENPLPGVEVNGSVGTFVDRPAGTDYSENYTEFDVQTPRDETLVLYETTTVSGTVRNPNGTAASNVTLRWWTEENGTQFEQVVTGPNGSYTANLLEDRSYEVEMWQADLDDVDTSEPTNVAYPKDDVADFAALGWHNTTATNETQNFTLPVGHTLNVTVENESGAPIENASVQLVDRQKGIWSSFYSYLHEDGVPTDAQGRMKHPPNPGTGIELNGSIDVTARPPEDTNLTSNETDVSVTSDRDVTLTLQKPTSIEGRWVGPSGGAIADATVYVVDWSTGVIESTTTANNGSFGASVPQGTYRIYVNADQTGDGIADSWVVDNISATGDTDVGNLTVPRGYATTVNVTDQRGAQVDAYTDVRGGNEGWIFGFGHGRTLDGPSNYDTRTVDFTNGSHSATIHDSWTHDVLGTRFVTVRGTDRTVTFGVDRFNGTRVSGAVGTTVVRDLQTPTDDQTVQDVLNQSINVRLSVLNATNETDLFVAELLPDGYELNGTAANISVDGPGHIENVTYGSGVLTFDVKGEVSEVRYQAVPNGTAPSEAHFAGEFGGQTLTVGETSLPAEANVSVFAPADGAVVETSLPTIRFVTHHPDAANVTGVEYRVDGGSWQQVHGTPAIGGAQLSSLADGQHTVTVRMVNENGTVVTDSTTFTVDTTA